MHEEIGAWMANPTRQYKDGLQLLETYGRNKALYLHLARKENTANWQKLEYELTKLTENEPVLRELAARGVHVPEGSTIIIMPPAGGGHVATSPPPASVPAAAPDVAAAPVLSNEVRQRIDELATKAGNLYREQAALSNKLDDATSDEERKALVEPIENLKQQRDAIAIERKRLEAGGPLELPADAEQPVVAPTVSLAEAVQERNNLRTSVSKAKKEVEKATTPEKKQKKQERLDKLTVQLEQADLQVKALQRIPTAG